MPLPRLITERSPYSLAVIVLITLLLVVAACSLGGDRTPTPTPVVREELYAAWSVSPSLEGQIFYSDVIVLATLASVTSTVETVLSEDAGVAPTYRAVQELRFTVHEYLKGSGPNVVLVVARASHTYLTAAEALAVAERTVAARTDTWDDRQAVVFLRNPSTPYASSGGASGNASGLGFTLSNYPLGEFA